MNLMRDYKLNPYQAALAAQRARKAAVRTALATVFIAGVLALTMSVILQVVKDHSAKTHEVIFSKPTTCVVEM